MPLMSAARALRVARLAVLAASAELAVLVAMKASSTRVELRKYDCDQLQCEYRKCRQFFLEWPHYSSDNPSGRANPRLTHKYSITYLVLILILVFCVIKNVPTKEVNERGVTPVINNFDSANPLENRDIDNKVRE